jgi:hypothetical protein
MPESSTIVLKKFFGFKQGQSLQDFSAELKELSPEDKKELSEAAAKQLGVELKID